MIFLVKLTRLDKNISFSFASSTFFCIFLQQIQKETNYGNEDYIKCNS